MITAHEFADFRDAKAELLRSIDEQARFGLLTGESGAGKTTLLRAVRQGLDRRHVRVIYFNHARLSPAGLVRVLARNLRVQPSRSQPETIHEVVRVLNDDPVATWLWVDEAQFLPDDTFDGLRTLAETDLDHQAAVSVLLAGLPELRERLQVPRLFPIWRRIETRLTITGLRADEVASFVSHAGGPAAQRLAACGIQVLFERARGLPGPLAACLRVLNRDQGEGPLDAVHVDELLQRWEA